jgi:uncharacterized membrane protein
MGSGRLEAFTDGVIAVIITIMVLELKAPHEASWHALAQSWPTFVSYVLSFIYVGIYWNNHHHLLHLPKKVNGKIMWANLFFLFWLSLFPFTTSWLAEAEPMPQPVPTAVYGFVLLMAAVSWIPLLRFLISANGGPTGELAGRAVEVEGVRIGRNLRGGDCGGFFQPHSCLCVVCRSGGDVVHSRSPDRKESG